MKSFLFFSFVLVTFISSAQSSFGGNNSNLTEIYDVNGWPLSSKVKYEIKGSPMLTDNWCKGSVKFSNGRILKDALLSFNLFNNQLYYKLEDIQFSFIDQISEFTFLYEENGKEKNLLFRSGYPGNTPVAGRIFYEVIAEGPRFQLLKHSYKALRDYYEYSTALAKNFRLFSDMYIYDMQTKSLKYIKNKQLLAELMPGQAEEIARLSGEKYYKFRSEKDLGDLVARLNQ